MKSKNQKSKNYSELRKKVEEKLKSLNTPIVNLSDLDVRELAHELQIHQIELEMQNEDLRWNQAIHEDLTKKYSALYDFAPVGYFTLDEKGLILEANRTGCKMLGMERPLLIGKHLGCFVVDEDNDSLYLHCKHVFKTKERQFCEIRILNKHNNTQFYAKLESTVAHDTGDGSNMLWVIISDISRQKRDEEEIKLLSNNNEKRTKHLASFPQCSLNPIIEIDFSGKITYCNNATVSTLKAIGVDEDPDAFLPEDIDKILQRSKSDKNENQINREITINSNTFELNIHILPEFKVVRIYTKDITTQKMAQIALEVVNKQLLHSEKLASTGKLAAFIAHEFNNSLCGIRNTLGIVLNHSMTGKLNANDQKLLNMSISECNRAAEIIKKLNDFNKPSTGVLENVNINDLIDNVYQITKNNLKLCNIKLNRHYNNNLSLIRVDSDQIKQVILNLLQNAIQTIPAKNGQIDITTEQAGPNILAHFKDNGCGIPEENMDKIFEPFFTTKEEVKGTGLGLSICYGITKKHNGKITVESREGKGSTFTISIPVDETG